MVIQQGDVVFLSSKIPESNLVIRQGNLVQHGEAGHSHVLVGNDFEMYDEPTTKKRYLRIVKPTLLKHEEHKEINLPAGEFEIRIVREYDHFKEESREVLD